MDEMQKNQIAILRHSGFSYQRISNMLGLSINSVKSYCRRHQLGGYKPNCSNYNVISKCEQCGKPVKQNPGRKAKRFCCDKCRMKWWNSHPDQVNRKAVYEITCMYCGKKFISYGKKDRKYCCHECYIKDRGAKA